MRCWRCVPHRDVAYVMLCGGVVRRDVTLRRGVVRRDVVGVGREVA